jgi:hypothetical protein
LQTDFTKLERNYIMQVVVEACTSTDAKVKVAGLENVVKITSLYYDKMGPYMQSLFNVSIWVKDLTIKDNSAINQGRK